MTTGQPDAEGAEGAQGAGGDAGYPSQVIPVALLIGVVAVGLIGVVARPRWTGPLHQNAETVGIALEVVLGALLIATLRTRKDSTEVAGRLRDGLRVVIPTMMVTLLVFLLINAHLRFNNNTGGLRPPLKIGKPKSLSPPKGTVTSGGFPPWILWVLGILVLIAIIVAALRLAARRPPRRVVAAGGLAMDPEDLKTALDEGAAALRAADYDDARKAIIACYVAMEKQLGDKNDADTPDELLAKATTQGLIHGPAAGKLTGLFYEARFSTHPLGGDAREQALTALDELRQQT
jgi:hypothetical protein